MHSPNTVERSWWRRLARRKRAEAARTNRLCHFEPLEQRTVLSAGMGMHDGDFFRTPEYGYDYLPARGDVVLIAQHGLALDDSHGQGLHLGQLKHDEAYERDSIYVPSTMGEQAMPLMPVASLPGLSSDLSADLDGDSYSPEGEAVSASPALESLDSSPESLGSLLTPSASLLSTAAAYAPATVPTYKIEIVIVNDDAPLTEPAVVVVQPVVSRVAYLAPSYVSVADNGVYASLYAAAMQRRVDPFPSNYGNAPRLGSLNAMSEDAGSATGKSFESTLQSSSASLLATLGSGSGVNPSASSHISLADDEGSNEQPLSPNAASRSSGDESDGSIELTAADLANQKRKLIASSEPRASAQTHLEQLTDIPVIRITESLFRELLVQYENSAPASAQAAQPVDNADDGLIELIAADTGSFAGRRSIAPANDHSQPVTVESGIALQQTLEVAGLDDIAEVTAAVQNQAAPVAPAEQIAKAE
jgi:hypothetical protein